mgnify:CR=1 FL=1
MTYIFLFAFAYFIIFFIYIAFEIITASKRNTKCICKNRKSVTEVEGEIFCDECFGIVD